MRARAPTLTTVLLCVLCAAVPVMAAGAGAATEPGAAPATAQDGAPGSAARAAAAQLAAAADQLSAATRARDRVAALTATVKAYEQGLNALREGVRRAAIRERATRELFEARREQLSRLLGVLQALGRARAPLLMVHPSGALGTARAGMMLSEITPALVAEARDLRVRLDEVRILQAVRSSAVNELRSGLAGVQAARLALSTALSERTGLPRRLVDNPDRLQALAESADTLQNFADSLPAPGAAPAGTVLPAPLDFPAAKGSLSMPVPGTVLHRFNEADAAGIRRPGVVLSAAPLSLVTAPWPATIRYRGPLLDYGKVMVLEPAEGYLLILAGLGTVYGEAGDIVDTGAPLGLLGGAIPAAEEFLLEATAGGVTTERETLYMEIRHQGMPVDPQDWFAQNRE